jgi:hypothetical protein
MATWVLIVFVISGSQSIGITSVPGYVSLADCREAGKTIKGVESETSLKIRVDCIEGPKK